MKHMNELKELYTGVDMRTILDRQVVMLAAKKNDLPDKPEEKKTEEKKPFLKLQEEPVKNTVIEPPTQIAPKVLEPDRK